MQNNVEPDSRRQLDAVFAQLNPQSVEEFYAAYQQWSLQQRINELRQRIEMVRAQQAENEQRLREIQPSAIALAALARLQSNGVSDITLLDAMLERGESWLDQTMQRLDYFEQFDDFISDDYTKWCQGALDGAFDWIDSLRENTEQAAPTQPETSPMEPPSNGEDAGDVEALLLQRLAIEREEGLDWQEAITLKRPAIQLPAGPEIQVQPAEYIPQDEPAQSDETAIASKAAASAGAEEQIIPEEASPVEDSALAASEPDQPSLIEFAPLADITPDEDEPHTSDDQPPLIESAPVDELSAEDEPSSGDDQPTFVEFAAPPPAGVSSPEEISEQETERAAPPEVPAPEEMAHREAGEPQEMINGAPENATPYQEEAISSNQTDRTAYKAPRKAGLMRRLVRLVTGI